MIINPLLKDSLRMVDAGRLNSYRHPHVTLYKKDLLWDQPKLV